MAILNPFSEKEYKRIGKTVGSFRYKIFSENDKLPTDTFSAIDRIQKFNYVIAGTGATTADYTFQLSSLDPRRHQRIRELTIPKKEEVVMVRFLTYDKKHGGLHCNAYDNIIFPTKRGDIFRLARSKPPDHYIPISEKAGIQDIADAFKLPKEKSGPISKYTSEGASLHIKVIPRNNKE